MIINQKYRYPYKPLFIVNKRRQKRIEQSNILFISQNVDFRVTFTRNYPDE